VGRGVMTCVNSPMGFGCDSTHLFLCCLLVASSCDPCLRTNTLGMSFASPGDVTKYAPRLPVFCPLWPLVRSCSSPKRSSCTHTTCCVIA